MKFEKLPTPVLQDTVIDRKGASAGTSPNLAVFSTALGNVINSGGRSIG